MNIFTDFHHSDLLYSLKLLFEKRLGHTLYRPIGMDWWDRGYWYVTPYVETAKQYLLDGFIPKDGTPPLNEYSRLENCIHVIKDLHNNTTHKAITLEQFASIPIDVVIASIPQHIEPFKKLITTYHPKAKFIFQMGNHFDEIEKMLQDGLVQNLLSSTSPFHTPLGTHALFYHQEFDTTIFTPSSFPPEKQITSFINILPRTGRSHYYYELKANLSEYTFKSYGSQTDDGVVSTTQDMAGIMKKSAFGFHAKYGGDGFGHVLFNWFACGKPVIICLSDYKGKLGEELLIPNETCFDLDRLTISLISDTIRTLPPKQYAWMCQRAYEIFKQKVNYEKEEQSVRKFLKELI